jgi:hypothetical protein
VLKPPKKQEKAPNRIKKLGLWRITSKEARKLVFVAFAA